ncbi:hypothetical protein R1T16_14020 [Flavobacterium sp. DG1-102-2]|uniref:hypothetical protein n=1 Tax=Flavobacterium sp. DG1-102-2 TaxID=3081663 RepID=UPI002949727C|nr:hypothetical protein [Flavobacterium sp. DG1-102-2]MDV6169548.1 hypothetical protein [Flavobacterium sp. DG1-102-2]
MSSTAQLLLTEFEALKNELIARYDDLGMRASGQWAESLSVSVSGNSAAIHQESYGKQLENGRRPGAQPPSEAIEQWLKDKGIANRLEKGMSVSSLAFLIARKIGREGWNRNNHDGTKLISSVVTPERIQFIIDKIGESQLTEFTTKISDYLNTLQA